MALTRVGNVAERASVSGPEAWNLARAVPEAGGHYYRSGRGPVRHLICELAFYGHHQIVTHLLPIGIYQDFYDLTRLWQAKAISGIRSWHLPTYLFMEISKCSLRGIKGERVGAVGHHIWSNSSVSESLANCLAL